MYVSKPVGVAVAQQDCQFCRVAGLARLEHGVDMGKGFSHMTGVLLCWMGVFWTLRESCVGLVSSGHSWSELGWIGVLWTLVE